MQRKAHPGTCKKCNGAGPFGKDRARWHGLRMTCLECDRIKSAADRASDPAKARAQKRKDQALYRARYPERVKAAVRAWLDKTPGYLAAQGRKWRAANPAAHRALARLYTSRRRERTRSVQGRYTPAQLDARVAYYGGLCAYCGGPFEHLDHVIPLSRGGSNWPANIRPACAQCNLRKHAKDWRAYAVRP